MKFRDAGSGVQVHNAPLAGNCVGAARNPYELSKICRAPFAQATRAISVTCCAFARLLPSIARSSHRRSRANFVCFKTGLPSSD